MLLVLAPTLHLPLLVGLNLIEALAQVALLVPALSHDVQLPLDLLLLLLQEVFLYVILRTSGECIVFGNLRVFKAVCDLELEDPQFFFHLEVDIAIMISKHAPRKGLANDVAFSSINIV